LNGIFKHGTASHCFCVNKDAVEGVFEQARSFKTDLNKRVAHAVKSKEKARVEIHEHAFVLLFNQSLLIFKKITCRPRQRYVTASTMDSHGLILSSF
jgi:hypothetical protein